LTSKGLFFNHPLINPSSFTFVILLSFSFPLSAVENSILFRVRFDGVNFAIQKKSENNCQIPYQFNYINYIVYNWFIVNFKE